MEKEKRPSLDLPGHGSPYADCGSVKIKGCDNVHAHSNGKVLRRLYKRSCRRKSCPTCFEGWAGSEAERSLVRFASYVAGKSEVRKLISDLKKKFATHPKRVFHEALVIRLKKLIKDGRQDRSRPLHAKHFVLSPPQNVRWDSKESYKK